MAPYLGARCEDDIQKLRNSRPNDVRELLHNLETSSAADWSRALRTTHRMSDVRYRCNRINYPPFRLVYDAVADYLRPGGIVNDVTTWMGTTPESFAT